MTIFLEESMVSNRLDEWMRRAIEMRAPKKELKGCHKYTRDFLLVCVCVVQSVVCLLDWILVAECFCGYNCGLGCGNCNGQVKGMRGLCFM